ncbi:Cupin_3 domain-containing protein [Gammaproteobacteria bacterium]
MSNLALTVEHNPTPAKLEVLGVNNWPIWTKEVSYFHWTYDTNETCYILAGEVIITPDSGEPVRLVIGDLVHFSANFSCTWDIRSPIKKHYRFSNE